MFDNIKAAIFDMDGTLIDSMWIWKQIDVEYLSKRNYTMSNKVRNDIESLGYLEVAKYFKENFKIQDSIEEIINEWNDMALYHYSHDVKLKSGAKQWLEYLKQQNIKIGLATSNSMPLVEAGLKANGIFNYFHIITTGDEVSVGKDCPDIYLLSAKKLGVAPENCVVFEDILPAVKGAKSAGMKVVAVHDKFSEHQKIDMQKIADNYILNYDELIQAV